MGTIAIQGIPTDTMEDALQMGLSIKQYLLAHDDIISLEKSDMPHANKWWILTPKAKLSKTRAYLHEEFSQYMNQSPLTHEYTPPGDMPNKTTAQTTQSLQTSKYTSELLSRLNARTPLSELQNHPPPKFESTLMLQLHTRPQSPPRGGSVQTAAVLNSATLKQLSPLSNPKTRQRMHTT